MGIPTWLNWAWKNSPVANSGILQSAINTLTDGKPEKFDEAVDLGWQKLDTSQPQAQAGSLQVSGKTFDDNTIFGNIANNIVDGKTLSEAVNSSYLGGNTSSSDILSNASGSAKELGLTNGLSGEDILTNLYNKTGDYSWAEKIAENRIAQENTASAREWEKMMSDTSFSRYITDIKNAGYNPWIALQGGTTASTPSVSAASVGSTSGSSQSTSRQNAKTDLLGKIAQALLLLTLRA